MKIIIFFLLALTCAHAYAENYSYPFTSTQDARRFNALTQEIRCVVCQNQNIADSNAPLAKDLREKIYHMVQKKQSDIEIKNYLVKRYGEFILLKPRLNQHTLLLWGFPFLILIFLFFLIVLSIRKQRVLV